MYSEGDCRLHGAPDERRMAGSNEICRRPGSPLYSRGTLTQSTGVWDIRGLLCLLAARGRHPAVIAFSDSKIIAWDSETLAREALRLCRELQPLDPLSRVMLWAPNSPQWIAGALAVLVAGHVLVPVDDMADTEQIAAALAASRPGLILTTVNHASAAGAILLAAL